VVEKSEDWPATVIRKYLNIFIETVATKLNIPEFINVTECTPCFSFWACLICDIALLVLSGGTYFFWPLSGIICLGFSWFIIQLLNAIDNRKN
jgi:TRAP-type mannitol/chloroaromatic compound transport system permease small subunit